MTRQIHHVLANLKHLSPREQIEERGLDSGMALLRTWQIQRLARTYADLMEQPRYRPACEFFLEDIYAARDFSRRDHDLETMYDFIRRFVPDSLSRPAVLTVNLHRMTEVLDGRLLDVLTQQLGVTDSITVAQYAEAYRLCDNYQERVTQIELIIEICEEIDGIVRNPLTGPVRALSRRPLRAAGYTEVVAFLERGYHSFKHMHGSHHFRKMVRERELSALDRIYARDPDPFGFQVLIKPEATGQSQGP